MLRTKIVHYFGIVTNKDVSAVARGREARSNYRKIIAVIGG
jgi:hypothetical protein